MLVSDEETDKWYDEKRPYYKDFKYLFQNPLWHLKVPAGFSVCPFFWFAMGSRLFFRPLFVMPISRILWPLLKAGGAPVAKADDWLNEFLSGKEKTFFGRGILCGIVALVVCVLLLFVTLCASILFYGWFHYSKLSDGTLVFFWASVVAVVNLGVASYRLFTDRDTHFKALMGTTFLLTMLALLFYAPGEFVDGFKFAGSVIVGTFQFVGYCAVAVWDGLCTAAGWCAKMLWSLLNIIAGVGAGILTASVFGLVWWGWAALMLGGLSLLARLIPDSAVEVGGIAAGKVTEATPEDYAWDWRRIVSKTAHNPFRAVFVSTVISSPNTLEAREKHGRALLSTVAGHMRDPWSRVLYERYFEKAFEEVGKNKISAKKIRAYLKENTSEGFQYLHLMKDAIKALYSSEEAEIIKRALDELHQLSSDKCVKLMEDMLTDKDFKESLAFSLAIHSKKEERKKERSHYCDTAYKMFNTWGDVLLWKPAGKMADWTWDQGVKIWGLVRRGASWLKDLIVAIWVLLKSNKQKVCPYKTFRVSSEDGENNS